jgi:hypothetical protein
MFLKKGILLEKESWSSEHITNYSTAVASLVTFMAELILHNKTSISSPNILILQKVNGQFVYKEHRIKLISQPKSFLLVEQT